MNKKTQILASIFLIISVIGIVILANNKNNQSPVTEVAVKNNQIILFYGDGCPHCALVEKFVVENNIETKVSFAKKEVYYNKQNASELAEKAQTCGMPTDSIGVPFLWDGSKCLVGDQDIIEFFKSKINGQ